MMKMASTTCSTSKRTASRKNNQQHYHHRPWWSMNVVVVVVLVVLVFILQPIVTTATATTTTKFVLDKDTREDCKDYIQDCSTLSSTTTTTTTGGGEKEKEYLNNNHYFFLQCPITCATALSMEGGIGQTIHDVEDYYYSQSITTTKGNKLSIDNYVDGYVTIFAMIPLNQPDSGMAQYYYEILEHIAFIYQYTLQIFIIPFYIPLVLDQENETTTPSTSLVDSMIRLHPPKSQKQQSKQQQQHQQRVIMVQESTLQNLPSVLSDFVLDTEPLAGDSTDLGTVIFDRVSLYIVSADAQYVERIITPTLTVLEERVPIYLNQLLSTSNDEL